MKKPLKKISTASLKVFAIGMIFRRNRVACAELARKFWLFGGEFVILRFDRKL
ncbi:MAG: hypothetical protein HUK12_00275 [Muribaculaceae bacterium]|nr:hypothetical protein [Muribaculaceae bacterium]